MWQGYFRKKSHHIRGFIVLWLQNLRIQKWTQYSSTPSSVFYIDKVRSGEDQWLRVLELPGWNSQASYQCGSLQDFLFVFCLTHLSVPSPLLLYLSSFCPLSSPPFSSSCLVSTTGHWTQGFILTRQALYLLNYTPSPFCLFVVFLFLR
jgi:hypothetical protein